MSKTPIAITLRADEWEEIALSLEFIARTCGDIAFTTTPARAKRYADRINKRIEASK